MQYFRFDPKLASPESLLRIVGDWSSQGPSTSLNRPQIRPIWRWVLAKRFQPTGSVDGIEDADNEAGLIKEMKGRTSCTGTQVS